MTANLLLVDDEPDAIELFRQSFRREIRQGVFAIHFARSGAEALRMLADGAEKERILLLSDINMPGMSGLELLGEVRRCWPDLVVILVTAYGDAENRRRAREGGANDFVVKPVDFAALKRTLAAYVQETGCR
jgi:CheY-like chemotaxis protein